ncbi:MAG: hypothetical protein LBL99_02155 [Holosporaceae bacterium]|jgi:hypothetical protein|nr:hypothetical protein [Holosporaceae bacterium]
MRLPSDNAFSFEKLFFYVFISVAVLFISFSILWNANWFFGDDFQLISTTAVGKWAIIGGWLGNGRMWPLGLIDYNILNFFPYGNSALGHYIWNTFTFLLSTFFLLNLFENITNKKHYYLISFCFFTIFASGAFIKTNIDVIYPERILTLLLSIFMYCSFKGRETQQNKYYIIAFLAACYATYCKEPVFGIFAIIALTNLIFETMTAKDKNFNVYLLLNSCIYLTIYYFLIGYKFQIDHSYLKTAASTLSRIEIINVIFSEEHILYPIFLTAVIRSFWVILKKDRKRLFFDGLIFASSTYALAYIFLGLSSSYYFVPCVIIAAPVFLYWLMIAALKKKSLSILLTIVMTSLLIEDFSASVKSVIWHHSRRKNDIKAISFIGNQAINEKTIYAYDVDLAKTGGFYRANVSYRLLLLNLFSSYCLGNSISIKKSGSFSEITQHKVLIYPIENYRGELHKKIRSWLEENNFTTLVEFNNMNIFKFVKINPIKIPFFHSFEPGVINTDLIYVCFGKINKDGAFSMEDSPVIKFKVDNHVNNLLVKCLISFKNYSSTENNIAFQVFVNEEIRSSFAISQNAPQTVSIFIPSALIKPDGMISLKFCQINKPTTEINKPDADTRCGFTFKNISVVYTDKNPDNFLKE